MKTRRITLHDIAELAGVTKMTINRYLRTPEKMKLETVERIASVIAEIGCRPDPDNPAITSVTMPRVGVLIPSFHNQIFADLLAGIESIAAGYGYQTLVMNYDYDRQREKEQIAAVLALNVKGLLLTESVRSLRADKYLSAAEIPIAEVVGLAENPGHVNVGFDNSQAGFDMATMLLASGKQRIIYFGSVSDVRNEQRYLGYCRAIENTGLAMGRIAPNKASSVSIGTGMVTLARRMYANMGGILCTGDDLAVGVLQEYLAPGINVPQELAITDFHGLEIGQIASPRLASVLTPRFEVRKVATEILIKKVKESPTIEKVGLHYRLLVGETV